MMYLGDFVPGATLYFTFNTRKGDGTPITFAGTPTLGVRKNAGAVMTLDSPGVTLAIDLVTGLHGVGLALTDADFVAGEYDIIVTAGTVDGVSQVGATVRHFSIGRATTIPTVSAIRTELETAGGTLALTKTSADAAARPNANMVATNMVAAAPTASAIRTELETADGKLDVIYDTVALNLDAKISTIPTSEQIRTELETAGGTLALTKLSADAAARPNANMVATNMVAAAPTVEQIRTELETADGKLDVIYDTVALNLDAKISDIEGGAGDVGLYPWTITVYKEGGVIPDPAAEVWLTADAVGTLPALRTKRNTDDRGEVTFHLDLDVVYYVQTLGSTGQENTPVRIVGGS